MASTTPREYEDTQHRQQSIDADTAGIGEPSNFTVPAIHVDFTSEPSGSSDVVKDDGLLLLETMKNRKSDQLHHDVLPEDDTFPTDIPVHEGFEGRLRRALHLCGGNGDTHFMPVDALDRNIHHDTVELYLSSMKQSRISNQLKELTTYICGSRDRSEELHTGKRLFASLILANKADAVTMLYDEGIYDKDLPLAKTCNVGSTFKLKKNTDDSVLGCFSGWADREIEQFEKQQRQMKPPFFAKDDNSRPLHYELSDRTCFPWVSYGEKKHLSANSDVLRVEIHPAQHDLLPKGNNLFALKTLKSKKPQEFNLEVEALKKIPPHSNLVTLLATYHYNEQYHLLFPWAEGDSLLELWRTHHPKPSNDSNWMVWLAEQCCGLAAGLSCIHDARMRTSELAVPNDLKIHTPGDNNDDKDCGRHGDIKPQNILWFRQEQNERGHGVLKISDFGLTMFHSELTTKVLPEKIIGHTQSYAAPELELRDDYYKVSRPYDIWSLGCIFMEFITWALLGFKGVEDFRNNRMEDEDSRRDFRGDDFYCIYKNKNPFKHWIKRRKEHAKVKPSVNAWIDYLLQQRGSSPYVSEFLEYIKDCMIQVIPSDRHKCGQVQDKLHSMRQRYMNP